MADYRLRRSTDDTPDPDFWEPDTGGLMPVWAEYNGNILTEIANGAEAYLPLDDIGDGTPLLDLTDPAAPAVLADGYYAATAIVRSSGPLTDGGVYEATLHLDPEDKDAISHFTSAPPGEAGLDSFLSPSCTFFIPAGGLITLNIFNADGVAAREFSWDELILVKLT